jgi:hypothetical protein
MSLTAKFPDRLQKEKKALTPFFAVQIQRLHKH